MNRRRRRRNRRRWRRGRRRRRRRTEDESFNLARTERKKQKLEKRRVCANEKEAVERTK